MAGTAKAIRRLEAFYDERTVTSGARGRSTQTPASVRLDALRRYRGEDAPAPEAAMRGLSRGPVQAAHNWTPLGPFAVLRGQAASLPVVSGRVRGIAVSVDGQRVYIGTANGGVWRSLDSGRNWDPMSDELELNPSQRQVDSLACGAIALVDGGGVGHDRVYVGTGEGTAGFGSPEAGFFGAGMLRSDDGCRTWNRETSNPDLAGAGVYALAVDPTNGALAIAATTQGVYRRTTGPVRWQEEVLPGGASGDRYTGATVGTIGGVTRFFVTTAAGRVFSSPGNGTWTSLGTLPGVTPGRVTLASSAGDPCIVYALACRPNGGLQGLHRISPSAAPAVWRTVANVPPNLFGPDAQHLQGMYDQALTVDPNADAVVYVGGSTVAVAAEWSGSVFRCTIAPASGGAFTCTPRHIGASTHGDIHVLSFRPGSSTELWVGCDGGVFAAADARLNGNSVFEHRNCGLTTFTLMGLDHLPSEESYAFCGVQDNGGIRWLGGDLWDHQLPGDGGPTVVNRKTGTRLLSGYVNTTVRRADIDGARYVSTSVDPPATSALFYPPMVASPTDGDTVFFGGEKPYVTGNFGTSWQGLPTGPAASGLVRSLAAVSNNRVYVGWSTGKLSRYDRAGAAWTHTDFSRTGEGRQITGIAVDPAVAAGTAVYVCIGGAAGPDHVWRLDTTQPAASRWASASGSGATALLSIQHNAILADPDHPARLWVAADLGVWTSEDSGATWAPLENGLPDVCVLDLDLLAIPLAAGGKLRLLRASTHGRGVFEMRLDKDRPPVELVIRANDIDQRYRDARSGVTLPGDHTKTSTLTSSPDIYIETPDAQGEYRLRGDRSPIVTELVALPSPAEIVGSVPGTPAITRVHVVVRNRGFRKVDGVVVSLIVGPKDAALPVDYRSCARGGTLADENGWKLAGTTTVNDVRAGRPAVVTFGLSSESLPPLSESAGDDYQLIALLHHPDDAFPDAAPADTNDPTTLVTRVRHSAMKAVKVVSGVHRAAPAGGTGLLVSMSTTVLAHRRLVAITSALGAKVAAPAPAKVHSVERRVLAMAQAGLANLESGPKPGVTAGIEGSAVGSYALLGSLGFELPAYASALLPGGGWVAENLRRGTGDRHLSHVAVPAVELPLKLASLSRSTSDPAKTAILAFSAGLLSSAAAGVVLSPQLADLYAQDTNADWSPDRRSRGSAALEHLLRQAVMGGSSGVTSMSSWLPAAADVPAGLWEQYVAAIEQTYGLPAHRAHGFGSFEADFDEGYWINPRRLAAGYGILLDDVRATSWSAWPWWGLLAPILIAPSLSLIAARALPHSKAFFEGGELTERSVFELLAASMGIGSVAPFVYSMMMWSKIEDHTEAFVTALLMFLARGALVGAALGTSDDVGQGSGVRWAGIFLPLAGADVYAGLRAALDSGRHPGNSTVFALQTLPAITGLTTLGLAGLARAIGGGDTDRDETKDDVAFWLLTLGSSAVFLTAIGIPVAMALSNGGGWHSWFMRDRSGLPMLSAVAHAGVEPFAPTAAARVFARPSLWPALGASVAIDQQNYPPGMRPLVRVWWEGDGDLTMKYDDSTVSTRLGGADTVIDLIAPLNATAVAAQLQAGLPGLKAEVVGIDEPALDLATPKALADAGDDAPFESADALRTAFVRVPTKKGDAIVLRQAPRVDQAILAGWTSTATTPWIVFPADVTKDDAGSGLMDAAELAALLVTAATPSMGTVTVNDARPALPEPAVREATQVFRRWNLDERRLDEWQSLITGHGATAPIADPLRSGQNMLVRQQATGYAPQPAGRAVAEAMGWLPLWRAWLTVASDTAADAGSNAIHAKTPTIAFPAGAPRKPKNRELTEGIMFLLDMAPM